MWICDPCLKWTAHARGRLICEYTRHTYQFLSWNRSCIIFQHRQLQVGIAWKLLISDVNNLTIPSSFSCQSFLLLNNVVWKAQGFCGYDTCKIESVQTGLNFQVFWSDYESYNYCIGVKEKEWARSGVNFTDQIKVLKGLSKFFYGNCSINYRIYSRISRSAYKSNWTF